MVATPAWLAPGLPVLLSGLQGRADLNGKQGSIIGPKRGERFPVGVGDEKVLLRSANLCPVDGADPRRAASRSSSTGTVISEEERARARANGRAGSFGGGEAGRQIMQQIDDALKRNQELARQAAAQAKTQAQAASNAAGGDCVKSHSDAVSSTPERTPPPPAPPPAAQVLPPAATSPVEKPSQSPRSNSVKGEAAKGEAAKGEAAKGEAAKGEGGLADQCSLVVQLMARRREMLARMGRGELSLRDVSDHQLFIARLGDDLKEQRLQLVKKHSITGRCCERCDPAEDASSPLHTVTYRCIPLPTVTAEDASSPFLPG